MPVRQPVLTENALEELEGIIHTWLRQFAVASRSGERHRCRSLAKELKGHGSALDERLKPPPKKWTKLERCKFFLVGLLGTTGKSAMEVFGEGMEQGFSKRTIRRALAELGATRLCKGWRKRMRWQISLSGIFRKILAST